MIVGVGLDVVELSRIARSIERFGDRFLNRVLTPGERADLPTIAHPYVAARFAAKEAASKALGTGFSQGVGPCSIEVVGGDGRKPELALHGAAAEVARRLGVARMHVSLTHGREVASAVVVLEALP